jgi:hypothetical protein
VRTSESTWYTLFYLLPFLAPNIGFANDHASQSSGAGGMRTSHTLPTEWILLTGKQRAYENVLVGYDTITHVHQAFGMTVLQHRLLPLSPDPALWRYVQTSARYFSRHFAPCLPSVRPVREGCDAEGAERSRLRRWAYVRVACLKADLNSARSLVVGIVRRKSEVGGVSLR